MRDTETPDMVVVPMTPADVPVLFPLLQLYDRTLTLKGWQRRARRLLKAGQDRKSGVILARYDGSRGPCGAALYRVTGVPGRGRRIFSVEAMPVATLGRTAAVAQVLMEECAHLATRMGCDETRFHIRGTDPETITRLCSGGFVESVILLHKNLTFPELFLN